MLVKRPDLVLSVLHELNLEDAFVVNHSLEYAPVGVRANFDLVSALEVSHVLLRVPFFEQERSWVVLHCVKISVNFDVWQQEAHEHSLSGDQTARVHEHCTQKTFKHIAKDLQLVVLQKI